MDIATGIARRPDDSAMEIATGIAARPRTVSHHVPTSRPSPRRPHDTQGPAVGSFEPQSDFVPIGEVAAASGGGGPTIFPIGNKDGTDSI